jgi:ankyrin repeat protein
MPSFLRALLNLLARARYLLPALLLAASAALTAHPVALAALLLALPLYFVGAAAALGYHLEQDFARFALRRGSVSLALIVGYAGLIAVATGWPALRLVETGTPLAALALALGFLFALIVLWRHWPVFALVLLWDDAYPESGSGSWMLTAIRRGNEFASHLTLERDPYFGRGLPLGLLLIATLTAAMSIAGLGGTLPSEFRTIAVWLYALVLAPATAFAFLWRTERLLLADAADNELAEGEAIRAPSSIGPRPSGRDPERLRVELLEAAAAGHVERALALLDEGADANAQPAPHERDQRSLVLLSATCPDLRLLRAAIAHGADVNRAVGDLTPLLAATRDSYQGRPESVMTLLANGADPRLGDSQGNTPLHHAALAREPAVAAILLDAEAPINALNRDGASPLAMACAAGNLTLAKFLLERGAAPNPETGAAALIAAASGADDRADLAKLLLKHRAQPVQRDRLGRTALHAAALHGHGEMADVLIGAGAELNARDQLGITPLMEAARGGHNRVLQRFVFRRPETEHADAAGRTALLIACQSARANEDTARLLLAMGADPLHVSRDGRRALDYAVAAGRWPVVKLLDPNYPVPASLTRDDVEPTPDGRAPDRATLLVRALRHGRMELARELCRLTPSLTAPELAQVYVACADAGGGRAAFELLLRQGLDPNQHDEAGLNLLQRLAVLDPMPLAALTVVARGRRRARRRDRLSPDRGADGGGRLRRERRNARAGPARARRRPVPPGREGSRAAAPRGATRTPAPAAGPARARPGPEPARPARPHAAVRADDHVRGGLAGAGARAAVPRRRSRTPHRRRPDQPRRGAGGRPQRAGALAELGSVALSRARAPARRSAGRGRARRSRGDRASARARAAARGARRAGMHRADPRRRRRARGAGHLAPVAGRRSARRGAHRRARALGRALGRARGRGPGAAGARRPGRRTACRAGSRP